MKRALVKLWVVQLFNVCLLAWWGCQRKTTIPPIVPPKNDTITRYEKTSKIDTIKLTDSKIVIQYLDTTNCPPSIRDTFIVSLKNCNCPGIEIKSSERIKTDTTIYREMTERFYKALVQNDSLKAQIVRKDMNYSRLKERFNYLLALLAIIVCFNLIKLSFEKWQLPQRLMALLKKQT